MRYQDPLQGDLRIYKAQPPLAVLPTNYFVFVTLRQRDRANLANRLHTSPTMKTFTSALLASAAASLAAAANFTEVALEEPLNWVVGTYLFPSQIIAGYNDLVDSSNWTESTWDANILAACESYTACTSSITWQGITSGHKTIHTLEEETYTRL